MKTEFEPGTEFDGQKSLCFLEVIIQYDDFEDFNDESLYFILNSYDFIQNGDDFKAFTDDYFCKKKLLYDVSY